jgi:hypothetical protein
MSQHVVYASKVIRSREILIAALASLGIEYNVAPEGETIPVHDMYGRNPRQCEVVVTREQLQKAHATGIYGDIGWYREADGTYAGYIDHLTRVRVSDQPGMVSLEYAPAAIERAYAKVAADKAVNQILTNVIPQWRAQNKIPPTATVRRETVGASTKIVLSYVTA